MPNHITNVITIHADEKKIKHIQAFMAAPHGRASSAFDFNNLIPMPRELLQGTARYPDDRLQEEQTRLKHLYGATNWYEWAPANWGTKWNAYYDKATAEGFVFDTAWATPAPIFCALSAQFPDILFSVEYADEEIGRNCGIMEYRSGAVLRDTAKDGDEEFAKRIRRTEQARYESDECSSEDNADAV